jgi:hypothetical protein
MILLGRVGGYIARLVGFALLALLSVGLAAIVNHWWLLLLLLLWALLAH